MPTFKPINSDARNSYEKFPFVEFSDPTIKTRRNLLVSSFLACCFIFFDLGINATRTPFLFISGLERNELDIIFTVLITYFLISFTWSAWNEVIKWRLNLTVGHPSDPNSAHRKELAFRFLKCLDDEPIYHAGKLQNLFQDIPRQVEQQLRNINDDSVKRYELEQKLDEIKIFVQTHWSNQLNNDFARIARFESWFWLYGKQQRVKFFTIDIGLPCVFGLISLGLLCQ
ncbi:hypothetical protein ACU8V4_14185 [Pseudoalteromonas mariniglutinosa]